MIFYFTGTGNSKWVAEQIANLTNDKAINIAKISDMPEITNQEQIGLVFPIYAWSAPEIVTEFVKTLKTDNSYIFAVATCGENIGLALKKLNSIYKISGQFSIKMPNNYIIGSDIELKEDIIQTIDLAKDRILNICKDINSKIHIYDVTEGKYSRFKTNVISKFFNKYARSPKAFYVEESCIGCGLCQKVCPISTINIVNGKPVWNNKCYQCLSCINHCPKTAIQFGTATKKRGRYYIEKYL